MLKFDSKSSPILSRKKLLPIFPSKDPVISTRKQSVTSLKDTKSEDGHGGKKSVQTPSPACPVTPEMLQKHSKTSGLSSKNGTKGGSSTQPEDGHSAKKTVQFSPPACPVTPELLQKHSKTNGSNLKHGGGSNGPASQPEDGHSGKKTVQFSPPACPVTPEVLQKHSKTNGSNSKHGGSDGPASQPEDGHGGSKPVQISSPASPACPVTPDGPQKHPKANGVNLKSVSPSYPSSPANCASVKVLISRPHPFTSGEPLDKYFSKYGKVTTPSVIQHGRSDYAYIHFEDPSSTEKCCAESPHTIDGVTVTAPCSKTTKGIISSMPDPAKSEYSCSPLVVSSVEKDAKRHFQDGGHQVKVLALRNKIFLEGQSISSEAKDYVRKSISEHEAKVTSIDETLDCCYLPALVDPSVQKKLKEIQLPFNLWIIAYDDSKTPCDLYYASVEELAQAYKKCGEKTVCAKGMKKYVFPEVDGISGYQWYWEDDQSVFQPYTESVCNRLERAFSAKLTVQESIEQYDYAIDTVNMQQTNVWSGRRRRIRRQITRYSFSVVICAQADHIQHARKLILDVLNSSLEKSTLSIPYVTWDTGFVDHLLQTARHGFVSADKSSEGGNVIILRGVPDVVKEIEINSMKEIFFAASREGVHTPIYWDRQRSKCELNAVQRGTKEWKDIEERMIESKFSFRILCIERIQNLWQWEAYEHSRKRMAEKNHGIVNEKKLFHGCSGTPPKKIYNSEQGFDNRLASKGVWGEGAYFAARASYSNNYAHVTPDGHLQIFLAHVLTGMTCKCEKNRSIKAPPMKMERPDLASSSSSTMFEDERYDSISGMSDGTEVFVIYEHGKVYPAYLITYKPSRFPF